MRLTLEHEAKHTSQNGEDGIIAQILKIVGEGRQQYIEIGVQDGTECNTRALANAGWTGVMIDQDHSNDLVTQAYVTKDNVQEVLRAAGAAPYPDVLSLDIDGNDFWVLANLGPYAPRVLICEYNAFFADDVFAVMPYTEPFRWDHSLYYGASQNAMHWLATRYGLELVYVENSATNMFFVEKKVAHYFDHAGQPEHVYNHRRWSHQPDKLNREFLRFNAASMWASACSIHEAQALLRRT